MKIKNVVIVVVSLVIFLGWKTPVMAYERSTQTIPQNNQSNAHIATSPRIQIMAISQANPTSRNASIAAIIKSPDEGAPKFNYVIIILVIIIVLLVSATLFSKK